MEGKDIRNVYAREVMRKPVLIAPNRTVEDAKNIMDKEKISCLCVSNGRRIEGTVKRGDITAENISEKVEDIMLPCKMSVVGRSDLEFVRRLICEEHLPCVLVMDNGKFRGVITPESLYEDGYLQ